ncbi:ankyrin repeat domain-containing protein SOWAHB-like [Heterodontus francisci]|uniref:ankyrin repeat domain-containing protein SOWAHB-like n=1 Tax=Heterodontus francisci TaxID=7792 RepID=UPI00355B3893
MAATFSQEAVLDFLLLHRGKVRNVDLTAHFSRFLRDPERQVQTRDQFKKFVNSLAVVKKEDGVKYIFLRKRYVELIPEEVSTSSDGVSGRPSGGVKARQRADQCNQPAAARQLAQSQLRAEARHQEAAGLSVSRNQHRLRGGEKAAPEDFSKLSADVVHGPRESSKDLPIISRGGNCPDEANRCTLLPEGCHSQPDLVNEVAKRANRSVIYKPTKQRSSNHQNKNRRPVATSFCTNDTVRLFNGDSNNSSRAVLSLSRASPNLSHLASPRSALKGKGEGIPVHEPPLDYIAEIISDEPVTESLLDQIPPENFVENSKEVFQNVQRQAITSSTHENKMIKHRKSPSSPKKHGSNEKVLKMSPGLITGSDAEVLVSSAVSKEECIQKNQRKPSAESGQIMDNKWHSKVQSILPKRHKPSLKKMKSNPSPHKTSIVPVKSNKSTTPKTVNGDARLSINDRSLSLTQTESHTERRKKDQLEIGEISEKSSFDPEEHEWRVKTANGKFEQAFILFCKDPSFVVKKDFISGYTVLHWLAKHGNHRKLFKFISHASKFKVELNVDVKSTCGYTPLHIAAIHGQLKIIDYLVKKYRANVNLRDHSGKKPWQYLNSEAPKDVCRMLGAPEHKHAMHSQSNSTFPVKDINRQGLSHTISRKTSFTALLKSPQILQRFMHSNSDHFHTIIEDDEED